jgi:hypothetical protein
LGAVRPADDPAAYLVELGVAYRENALASPDLYAVMFGRAVPEFEPDPDDTDARMSAMEPLVEAVRAASSAGLLVDVEPELVALALWGVAHGLVSLELSGSTPEGFEVAVHYRHMLGAAVRGWLRDPGPDNNA